ncbi:hypothetical protein F5884DRAFT_857761 [Xylogone sp. PMI_703]|nr:hypothetical protein F5884DRAFT_857761 [Xylogone sp. PMI_703]
MALLHSLPPNDHPARLLEENSPALASRLKHEVQDDLSSRDCNVPGSRSCSPLPQLTPGVTSLHPVNSSPESSSINDILRQHCRTRLYVPAIGWTSDQLQLLDCRFSLKRMSPSKRSKESTLPSQKSGHRNSQTQIEETYATRRQRNNLPHLASVAAYLFRPCTMEFRKSVIAELLSSHNIHPLKLPLSQKHCDSVPNIGLKLLPFFFGGRVVNVLHTDGIFSYNSVIPDFAYVGFDTIHTLRHKYINVPPLKRQNLPVVTIREKKLHRLHPKKEAEDPYIIAILIALAQQNGRAKVQEQSRHKRQPLEGNWMHTPLHPGTHIPPEFLDKFDMPSRFSPSRPVSVLYSCIYLSSPQQVIKQLDCALRTSGIPSVLRANAPADAAQVHPMRCSTNKEATVQQASPAC